jgi:hypothetical protein
VEQLKKIGFWGWFSLAVVALILVSLVAPKSKPQPNQEIALDDSIYEKQEPIITSMSDSDRQQCVKNLRAVEAGGIIVEWSGDKIRMNSAIFANLKENEQVGLLNGVSCAHHGLKLTDLRGQQFAKIVDSDSGKTLMFGSDGGYHKP